LVVTALLVAPIVLLDYPAVGIEIVPP
jgi:hypothetical protein